MDKDLVITILSCVATIISVVYSNRQNNREVTHKLETNQAVTDTKLDTLTAEVQKHNSFAERVPVMEVQLSDYGRRLEVIEHEVQRQNSKAD